MVMNVEGEVIAEATTSSNGLFKFKVQSGRYEVAARVGPPSSVPGHSCGKPLDVTLTRREHLYMRIVCNLR
jgi:hypothetical protein